MPRRRLLEMLVTGLGLMHAVTVEPDTDLISTLGRLSQALQINWSTPPTDAGQRARRVYGA